MIDEDLQMLNTARKHHTIVRIFQDGYHLAAILDEHSYYKLQKSNIFQRHFVPLEYSVLWN